MENYIQEKINKIKINNSFGIIIETGAGSPVYNELAQYPNTASKIVYYSESPNNWEYNKKKYKHAADIRAISPEVCKNLSLGHLENFLNNKINFLLTSTIQIANEPTVQTHGWFSLMTKCWYIIDNLPDQNTKIYHFTINGFKSRKEYNEIITKIGLDIIASQNDIEKLDNGYIDQVLNFDINPIEGSEFTQNLEDTVTSIVNGKLNARNWDNTSTIIKQDGKIIRLNELLRTCKKELVVFKGSFNPVHDGHLEIITGIKIVLPDSTILLAISARNREKDKIVDVPSLLERIKYLNSIGYDVLVDNMGFYYDSYKMLMNNPDFNDINLNYIMGSDTITRFLTDEGIEKDIDISNFNLKWLEATFWWGWRGGYDKPQISSKLLNVNELEIKQLEISSSDIRNKKS